MSGRIRKRAGRSPELESVYAEVSMRATARDYAEACDADDSAEEERAWRELRDAALAYAKLVQR